MLSPDLETWLTAAGDRVLRTPEPWSPGDQLLHELWLFDTEVRNGGVSQYFGNWPERWSLLTECAANSLSSFAPVAAAVDEVISGPDDPYEAALAAHERLDWVWEEHQEAIVRALRAATVPLEAGVSESPLMPGLEPLLSRRPVTLEGPDGQEWTLDLDPGLEPWMTEPLPAGALIFADNGVGDHLFLSPDEDGVMVLRHEGPEIYLYCAAVEELDPDLERPQSDHPPIRYHGTEESVRLGDRVEVRYRLFFKDTGRVIYVPGLSPKRPALERGGLAWVAVRFDGGGGIETIVMPDGALKKTVKLLARDVA